MPVAHRLTAEALGLVGEDTLKDLVDKGSADRVRELLRQWICSPRAVRSTEEEIEMQKK
jgi:hypothetical protein